MGHLSCTYSIVEHCVLGHAVRFAELLDLPSIVTEHHLLAKATAVGARAQGAFLFEELLTVWGERRKRRIYRINNPKLVNESVKPAAADLTSGFTLITLDQNFTLFQFQTFRVFRISKHHITV